MSDSDNESGQEETPMAETVSREIRLKNRPVGLPHESDFELATVPIPTPGAGQVLVHNLYTRRSSFLFLTVYPVGW